MTLQNPRLRFRDFPIRRKLVILIMAVTGVAVLLSALAFGIYDYFTVRDGIVASARQLATLVGESNTAALSFDDAETASEGLAALAGQPSIAGAALYRADGSLFVMWSRNPAATRAIPSMAGIPRAEFRDGALLLMQPVSHGGQRVGSIIVLSTLDALYARLGEIGALLLTALLLGGITAYLLSSRLQRLVSGPILSLADTARAVSDGRNFAVRAVPQGRDEVGMLVDQFNAMLDVIQQQDAALREEIGVRRQAQQDLKEFAARLERSNRELQDFASVASHDLQEPLRKVQAFGDRLSGSLNGSMDERSRDYLDRMLNATRRMQTLINDLLTYSRVTTKAQPFVPTSLAVIVDDVLADLEVRIEQAGGTVTHDRLPRIDADPLQMRQLFQNLIGNALKFHRPDAPPVVRITSETLEGEGEDARAMARIRISDNGIGFDEKYREQIFVIFQRLHGRSEYEGTGIGLSVCKKIVDRHDGRIEAFSTPGNGATFVIDLPLAQRSAALPQQQPDGAPASPP